MPNVHLKVHERKVDLHVRIISVGILLHPAVGMAHLLPEGVKQTQDLGGLSQWFTVIGLIGFYMSYSCEIWKLAGSSRATNVGENKAKNK